jgi:hypothetical protein
VIPSVEPAPPSPSRPVSLPRVKWFGSIVFCGVLPVVAVIALFVTVVRDDSVAFDFRPFYSAAESIMGGESPYPAADDPLTASAGPYVYPPVGALATIPLTVLPREAAGLLVMAVLLAAALATLALLGVRDWRCHGIVLLWPPVLSAIQTGNVTLLLGLAAAVSWRFRDRMLPSGGTVGTTLGVKFLLWPLFVWLAATRRMASAAVACLVAGVLLLASWAAIGFAGLREYPDLLRRLEDTVGHDSYSVFIVGLDVGLPSPIARAVWLALGLGLLAAVLLLGRLGDERSAFILAIAAALALSPLVWLHYFALLAVVVALAQPRLGLVWFLPLAMVMSPGSGNPTLFETLVVLGGASVTIALSLHAVRRSTVAAAEVRRFAEPTTA